MSNSRDREQRPRVFEFALTCSRSDSSFETVFEVAQPQERNGQQALLHGAAGTADMAADRVQGCRHCPCARNDGLCVSVFACVCTQSHAATTATRGRSVAIGRARTGGREGKVSEKGKEGERGNRQRVWRSSASVLPLHCIASSASDWGRVRSLCAAVPCVCIRACFRSRAHVCVAAADARGAGGQAGPCAERTRCGRSVAIGPGPSRAPLT